MIIHRVYCLIMIDFLLFVFMKHQQHLSSNCHIDGKMLSCLQTPASAGCRDGAAGRLHSTQHYKLQQHCHVELTCAIDQVVKPFTFAGSSSSFRKVPGCCSGFSGTRTQFLFTLLYTRLSLSGSISFDSPKLQRVL